MLAKQIRFKNIESVSKLISFKGFIISKLGVIIDTDFTVVKGPSPLKGSLNQTIIKSGVDYSTLVNIEYGNDKLLDPNFEIIIEFPTEVDFDNIQCVCGNSEDNHFRKLLISYNTSNNNWKHFNRATHIPTFLSNGVSNERKFDPIIKSISNFSGFFDNDIKLNPSSNGDYNLLYFSPKTMKTGKYFLEVTEKNTKFGLSNAWNCPAAISETTFNGSGFNDVGKYGVYADYYDRYYLSRHINGSPSNLQPFGPTLSYNQVFPEMTIALFIDLDLNKAKAVFNGSESSGWHDIPRTKPDSSYHFYGQFRNLGNFGFSNEVSLVPKYEYPDLTSDYVTDIFFDVPGWSKQIIFIAPSNKLRPMIPNDHTLLKKGILFDKPAFNIVDYPSVYRLSDRGNDLPTGYGYFKNSVFIDYPPKEPTSKKVVLFSIKDNINLKTVWSDPLTGQYEFKHIPMKHPYLIFTYDTDEDYNAVILGPVYPTLMPEFVGKV